MSDKDLARSIQALMEKLTEDEKDTLNTLLQMRGKIPIWTVRFANYEPVEIDSIWSSEALAELRCKVLNDNARRLGMSAMWEVGMMILDSVEGD